MKQEFIDFLNALMEASPDVVEKMKTESVQAYINILMDGKADTPVLTDNGKVLLKFLQENANITTWKAKDVAEKIGVSSRGVSGAFRKLVIDGFCEKFGKEPTLYSLTEKGKNFIIED